MISRKCAEAADVLDRVRQGKESILAKDRTCTGKRAAASLLRRGLRVAVRLHSECEGCDCQCKPEEVRHG